MRADRPADLKEFRRILASADEKTRLISGGTDLTIHIRSHPEEDLHLVDISHLEEMRFIRVDGDTLEIGASVTFTELEHSDLILEHAKCLALASSRVGSPQIRNRGTLGGNVANASAAADGVPALCALEAAAIVENSDGQCEALPVEKVVLGMNRTLLKPDSYIRSFRIPLKGRSYSDFSKVGSRRAVTISKLSLALAGRLEAGSIISPRIFVGAVSPTPVRAAGAEAILRTDERTPAAREAFL
jgi:CO/xanthine dehydrogenase FAD-binding subunit